MAAPGRDIPVFLSAPIGRTNQSFVACPPIIYVHLGADLNWNPAGTHPAKHNGKFYSGLIDTGSDHTAIRPLIAAEIGASPTDMGVVVHGHGSQIQAMKAPLQVIVPSANVTFSCDAVIVDLTGDSRSFDLILGRNFLRHCHLAVDGPACKYRLTWIG